MSFDLLQLDARIRQNIRGLGFEVPTPIQRKAIPAILEGHDVIGLAQTGTGKTAAFGIPLLHRLINGPRHRLRILIVGPTRELAEQTREALIQLGAHTNLRCITIYGGVGMSPQVAGLRQGAEVVVACPGRLLDHIRQNTVDLSHVECLVLDEADRMFDMGFLPDIRKILSKLPARRQTLLFSATMPDEVRGLAHEVLRHPVTMQIAHSKPAESVSHALYPVAAHLKTPLLTALLEQTDRESVLVFTRTKHRTKRLAAHLGQTGHRAASLQGNMSQRQRQQAMDGFRSGRFQVLVATDLAARGLDVSSISHVINYDMPKTVDDYTHRIGRTGRAAKTGDAFTFVTPEDEGVVRAIERVLGAPIERRKLDGFNYTARPAAATPHRGTPPPAATRGGAPAPVAAPRGVTRSFAPRHRRKKRFHR
ncbi:MAG: DEAD/DEAH box helicase [Kiritimatiellae bacterium]|nr:DEAD/DEAH box helicase [Kiritimatiellia bacterium]